MDIFLHGNKRKFINNDDSDDGAIKDNRNTSSRKRALELPKQEDMMNPTYHWNSQV